MEELEASLPRFIGKFQETDPRFFPWKTSMERQIDCFLKGVSVLSIWKFSVQGWCQYTDYCVCFENMGDSHKSSLGHGHQNRGHVVQVLWRDLMMGWGWKTGRFSKWQHGRTSPSPHMEACFSKWALAHEFLCSFFCLFVRCLEIFRWQGASEWKLMFHPFWSMDPGASGYPLPASMGNRPFQDSAACG